MTRFRDITSRHWAIVGLVLLSFAAMAGCATTESCCDCGRAPCAGHHVQCAAHPLCGATVWGPCYGYCPTCWSAWPACCEMCPPPGQPALPGSSGRCACKEHAEPAAEAVHIVLLDTVEKPAEKPVAKTPEEGPKSNFDIPTGDSLMYVATRPAHGACAELSRTAPQLTDLAQPSIRLSVDSENAAAEAGKTGLVPPVFRSPLLY